ncbi:AAA family ATPase [uncultured Pseudoteredinibacter sp.]|uniref:AAA family ATPase n=1 Tax=uncultured Pseudoteredinibacter sp. TaxID=1641701 RepID=UPI00260B5A95|nr:AAA family ATPase [uncultured Pseudoteredinibacter sp.]
MDTLAEYLDYYGFSAEPFVGKGGFFSTSERAELLDQIEHWCDFGSGVIVVEGEAGIGKTALLQEFSKRCDDGALISQLDGPVLAGLDQMLMLLAAELGVDLVEGQTSGAMLGHLRKHVKSSSRSMFVLVDQAHKLDDRALLALMGLLQGQQAGDLGLNVVVFAEPGLAERLSKFDVADVIVNQKSIERFSQSQLASYIHHQLAAASYDGPELFSDMELKELFKASGGLPAQIDVLSQNLLINRLYNNTAAKKGFPAWHVLGVGALLSILATAFVYRAELEQWWQGNNTNQPELMQAEKASTKTQSSAVSQASEAPSDKQAVTAEFIDDAENLINEALTPSEPTIASNDASVSDGGDLELQEAALPEQAESEVLVDAAEGAAQERLEAAGLDAAARQALPQGNELPQNDSHSAEQMAQQVAEPELPSDDLNDDELSAMALADVNELQDSQIDYSAYSQEELARIGMDPAFDLSVFTEDEQYLLRLSDSAYVLQLIAVRTTEQVEKFMRVQSNRADLKIFNRERDGKSWYVIVQPGFDTWEQVEQAQSKLPSRQRSSGAWARSLKIIKADIRSFRGI